MQQFFEIYPTIFEDCCRVIDSINSRLNGLTINKDELNIDLLFPFLFTTIGHNDALRLAMYLRLYREVIDFYNKGNEDVATLKGIIENDLGITVATFNEYDSINKKNRKCIPNEFGQSYFRATERVFYRLQLFDLFDATHHFSDYNSIHSSVKALSAFLIFDDDVYDLEEDLQNNRQTILIDYLQHNQGNLQTAIQLMTHQLDKILTTNNQNRALFDLISILQGVYL